MEGLKSFYENLRNLRSQAGKLVDAGFGLDALFAEEETRLERQDEVSILEAVRSGIAEQLQESERVEASASQAYSAANHLLAPIASIVRAIVAGDNRPSIIEGHLLHERAGRRRPFGLVMVSVGPNGLPDDARVVSVSQLARGSNRTESEVMHSLHETGCLLFSGEVFSSLIDKLAARVRYGKLRLPVSNKKLAEIAVLNEPKPRIKVVLAE
jgi:hypothetical protein